MLSQSLLIRTSAHFLLLLALSGPSFGSRLGDGYTGNEVAVATFTDSACTNIFSFDVVSEDTCTYTSALGTYFSVSVSGGYGEAEFACNSDCSSCSTTLSGNEGNCFYLLPADLYTSASSLQGTTMQVSIFSPLFPVLPFPPSLTKDSTHSSFKVGFYSDDLCSIRVDQRSVSPNTCTYLDIVSSYGSLAMLGTGYLGIAFNCDSDCVCQSAIVIPPESCLNIGNGVYAQLIDDNSAASSLSPASLVWLFIFSLLSLISITYF